MTQISLSLLLLTLNFGAPGSSQLPSPRIDVQQKTSLGLQKEIIPDSSGNFVILGNVEEIQLTCWSSYPTKWMMIPSPHKGGSNIKEWQIDKGRHTIDMKSGKMEFWSEVVLRFTNNPHRILNQNAACHHFEDTSVNVNVSISSMDNGVIYGTLIANDVLKRSGPGKMSERYGRNKNCSLVMHLDVKHRKLECENLLGFQTNPPDLIQCANPDECEASVQLRDMTNCVEEYDPIDFNFICTTKTCSPFGTKSGALICEYPEGGRRNSLSQIIYFGFNHTPYFQFPGSEDTTSDISTRLKIRAIGNFQTGNIYHNGTKVKFRCSGVIWHYSQGIEWGLRSGENQDITYLGPGKQSTKERTSYSSEIEIIFPSVIGSTEIVCKGPLLNSFDWEEVTLDAEVKESRAPTILNLTAILSDDGNHVVGLHCDASGEPLPDITWKKNGVHLSSQLWNTTNLADFSRSILSISRVPGEIEEYTCEAFNSLGDKMDSSTQVTHSPSTINVGMIVGILLSIILLSLLIICIIYLKIRNKYRNLQMLTEDEIREFTQGNIQSIQNTPDFYPYNTDYEIPKNRIHFESKVLGDGQFGKVTRGKIDKSYVAIKTIQKFADISYLKALLSELKICCYVGKHDHIVNLIGGCTENIHKREVYLIYEYCANGNILKYLRKYRDQFVNHLTLTRGMTYNASRQSIVDYQNISVKKVSSKDLLRWAAEIASGMEFLSDKNIVHGDLAARNILLTESLKAKVGDFGLSKQLQDYSIYVQKLECPLPLKWMAIESLRDLEFSVKSDVWSYGVTLWEIYSLGQPPYPGLPQWDCTTWKMLQDGYRMEKPPYASDEVFNCILRCWLEDPDSRPTFSTLKNVFEGLLILVTGAPSLKIY